ncbi:hypothetical protein B0H13DRAFT_1912025 [Mycena leptocephala]|nr:hypothetical protein B0H13DRAFT_1912025 [Mycena leptocephala]
MDFGSDRQSSPDSRIEPWLDPRYFEPPMPMENSPYASLLIEPHSIESDPDSAEPVTAVCRRCCTDLKANKVPPLSTANNNYLGPVPPELKDLTIVEEAMILLCRAKCWIVQLRGDDSDTKTDCNRQDLTSPNIRHYYPDLHHLLWVQTPPTAEWLKHDVYDQIFRLKTNITERIYSKSDLLYF